MSKTIANRFQIGECIGAGGMGTVYAGVDLHTAQEVAIKFLKRDSIDHDPQSLNRFRREGAILLELNHPNIIKVLDVVECAEEPCIVMELVRGGTVADLIQQSGPLSIKQTLDIALECSDALARAHHLSVIHRDVKPSNIFLDMEGCPYLADFGLAQQADMPALTATHAVVGTLSYMSPEAYNGQVLNSQTDIWSFGVMLFEMLAGIRPFRGKTVMETLKAILTEPPNPDLEGLRPDIPESLAILIYKMLEKDPGRRIDSMRRVASFSEDLQNGKSLGSFLSLYQPSTSNYIEKNTPKHNLPETLTSFVGREDTIRDVIGIISQSDCRLLSLVGQGGIGKTRFALEVAKSLMNESNMSVYMIELARITTAHDIPTSVAQSLGMQFATNYQTDRSPEEQIIDYLREKDLLLVFDNCEHLLSELEII